MTLKTFRNAVEKDLYQDFMTRNDFLAPWLKARRWNAEDASHMLKKHLKWRKENRVDAILENLDGKCGPFFAVQMDSVSRDGLPVTTLRIRDFDVRKAVLSGKPREYSRCMFRFWEQMRINIMAQNERFRTTNITGFIFVGDNAGINLRQHACVPCIPVYLNLMTAFEAYYPRILIKCYLVNMATVAQTVFEAIKGVMTETTRNSLAIYGFDKAKWQLALMKDIAPDQLPPEFGGVKGCQSKE